MITITATDFGRWRNTKAMKTTEQTRKIMTAKELTQAGYKIVRTALTRGYASTNAAHTEPVPYDGKYGVGYTTKSNNPESTRYCFINYWIKK